LGHATPARARDDNSGMWERPPLAFAPYERSTPDVRAALSCGHGRPHLLWTRSNY